MRLFGRKKQETSADAVPDEIKDYYQAEKRDRMWVVWLLSGVTFIITVVAVLGLFWAGRWTVKKIAGNDEKKTGTTIQEANPEQEQQTAQGDGHQAAQNDPSTSAPAPSTTAPSTPAAPATTAQTPSTTPQTGPATAELPHTGPSSDE